MPTRTRRKEYALSNVEEEGFEIRKIPQKEETHGDNYQTLQKVVIENLSLTKRLAATVKELQDENKLLKEEGSGGGQGDDHREQGWAASLQIPAHRAMWRVSAMHV
jgi:hypothetical protein